MKILLMGPQGCGKGTIGGLLSKKLGIPLLSVGQLLRDIPKSHPQYQEVQDLLARGQLIPVEVTVDLMKNRTQHDDCRAGYLMDGWGRRMADIEFFNPGYDHVIYFKINPETILNRLSTRRTCSQCGAIYNIVTIKPKVEGICDKCGGTLIQRSDDTAESIQKRLDIFNKETQPVIEHFRSLGLLREIDGEGLPQVVLERALSALKA